MPACACGWEALRGDSLPWLLDETRPNLHWRVLVELVGRPPASPAVERARGGANACEPIAGLLADLLPDGRWTTDESRWTPYRGPGWRVVAALQWGADPSDPRLHAACDLLLEDESGVGGFAPRDDGTPSGALTARLLQALAELGYCRHLRFQEALAWLEEDGGSWADAEAAVDVAVPLLASLTSCPESRRHELRERAVSVVVDSLKREGEIQESLEHPKLGGTDLAEALWVLARAGVGYRHEMERALGRLQAMQLEGGRWPRHLPAPESLPLAPESRPEEGQPSRWVTLRAVVAMNAFAVDAGLPRLFPERPG
jgi:hypothetical protein